MRPAVRRPPPRRGSGGEEESREERGYTVKACVSGGIRGWERSGLGKRLQPMRVCCCEPKRWVRGSRRGGPCVLSTAGDGRSSESSARIKNDVKMRSRVVAWRRGRAV